MRKRLNRWTSRRRRIDFLALIALLGFVLVAALLEHQTVHEWDHAIIRYVQSFEQPWLTRIAIWLSVIGSRDPIIVMCVFVMAFLYLMLKHRMELLLLIGVMLGSSILNIVLKLAYQRMRPDIHRLIEVTGYSFPSGHSMAAFSFYGILAYLLWRHMPTRGGRVLLLSLAVLMIICMGLSRIYLGVHYPSDVLGGYFAASFWLALSIRVYEQIAIRRPLSA